LQTVRHCFNI